MDVDMTGWRKATEEESKQWTATGKVDGYNGPFRLVAGSGLWMKESWDAQVLEL